MGIEAPHYRPIFKVCISGTNKLFFERIDPCLRVLVWWTDSSEGFGLGARIRRIRFAPPNALGRFGMSAGVSRSRPLLICLIDRRQDWLSRLLVFEHAYRGTTGPLGCRGVAPLHPTPHRPWLAETYSNDGRTESLKTAEGRHRTLAAGLSGIQPLRTSAPGQPGGRRNLGSVCRGNQAGTTLAAARNDAPVVERIRRLRRTRPRMASLVAEPRACHWWPIPVPDSLPGLCRLS